MRNLKTKPLGKSTTMIFILLFLFNAGQSYAQSKFSLDSCKQRVLEHNHEIIMSRHAKEESQELLKSARTQHLPRISANAAYLYKNKPYSYAISIPELNLPVGSIGSDGNWTITPDDTDNTWVPMGDTYVPLDASGQPFDPTQESEKLLISDWVNVPEIDTTLEIGQHHNMLGTVSINQPVYMGGKIRQTVKLSEYMTKIADAALQGTISDVLYKTDEAYYQILTLEEKKILAESAIEMLNTLITDLENYHSEGLINNNDLMKAKVKRNEAELNLQKVNNGLILSKMFLNQMMGRELNEDIILTDKITESIMLPSDNDYKSQAMNNRYELKALNEQLNISESKIKIARSQYLPNIVLSGNYFVMTPNPYDSFKNSFGSDWNVSLVCNIPIFHWNDRLHTLRAAQISHESSNVKMEQTRELINLQVQQAILKCQETSTTIIMAEANLEQANENLRLHRENLKEGTATVAEVLEAQLMWQKAYDELINARSENQLSISYLNKVSGTIN